MRDEWPVVRLGDLVEVLTGFPFKSALYSSEGGGIRLLRGDNVVQGAFRWKGVKLWPEKELIEKHRNYWLEENDVILAMDRPWIEAGLKTSQVTKNDLPCLLVQRVASLRAKKCLDQNFLRYLIASYWFTEYVKSIQTGTAVPHISPKQIKSYEFHLPTEREQRQIGLVLRSLDDKIELNRQMNATLEAMAQALFKSWFVDFDPVIDNALAAGNPIPEPLHARAETRAALGDQCKPLPEAIQKQFPSSFVFSEEMGWIPEGWEVKQAQDVATITIGKTPPRKETQWFSEVKEGNCIWISIRDMGNSGVFIGDSSEYLVPESIAKYNVKVIPKGSVLLSFKLTLGRVAIALSEMATNEAIAHFVSPRCGLNKEYIYCYLSVFDFGKLGSTSSIATAVNSKLIKAMPFIVPSEDVLYSFEKMCTEWFSRMALVDGQTDSLVGLRDTLLPKLLSGQFRIPDAEKLVAEAV